jgi:hypothetical protein
MAQFHVLVQAITDPTAKANINTICSTGKFTYVLNPVRYDMKSGYYMIGSEYKIDNKTKINQQPLNATAITSISRNETARTFSNITKTILKAQDLLIFVIDKKPPITENETAQTFSNITKTISKNYDKSLTIINKKFGQIPRKSEQPPKQTIQPSTPSGGDPSSEYSPAVT